MNIVLFLVPFALLLGGGFVAAFIWANSQGQYDDLVTPAERVLFEEKEEIHL
jgi:cbb3-type cytochrome oxidase maturation protein